MFPSLHHPPSSSPVYWVWFDIWYTFGMRYITNILMVVFLSAAVGCKVWKAAEESLPFPTATTAAATNPERLQTIQEQTTHSSTRIAQVVQSLAQSISDIVAQANSQYVVEPAKTALLRDAATVQNQSDSLQRVQGGLAHTQVLLVEAVSGAVEAKQTISDGKVRYDAEKKAHDDDNTAAVKQHATDVKEINKQKARAESTLTLIIDILVGLFFAGFVVFAILAALTVYSTGNIGAAITDIVVSVGCLFGVGLCLFVSEYMDEIKWGSAIVAGVVFLGVVGYGIYRLYKSKLDIRDATVKGEEQVAEVGQLVEHLKTKIPVEVKQVIFGGPADPGQTGRFLSDSTSALIDKLRDDGTIKTVPAPAAKVD